MLLLLPNLMIFPFLLVQGMVAHAELFKILAMSQFLPAPHVSLPGFVFYNRCAGSFFFFSWHICPKLPGSKYCTVLQIASHLIS